MRGGFFRSKDDVAPCRSVSLGEMAGFRFLVRIGVQAAGHCGAAHHVEADADRAVNAPAVART
jgi:hypothetical protein